MPGVERLLRVGDAFAAAPSKAQDVRILQLVLQLVVGHAMWTTGVEVVLVDEDSPPHVRQIGRVLDKWNPDRELELGIDALVHGFERLLE